MRASKALDWVCVEKDIGTAVSLYVPLASPSTTKQTINNVARRVGPRCTEPRRATHRSTLSSAEIVGLWSTCTHSSNGPLEKHGIKDNPTEIIVNLRKFSVLDINIAEKYRARAVAKLQKSSASAPSAFLTSGRGLL